MHMTPAKWWISACKAAEVLSTQLSNAREFDDAHGLLELVACKIVALLGEHFLAPEKDQDDKVL